MSSSNNFPSTSKLNKDDESTKATSDDNQNDHTVANKETSSDFRPSSVCQSSPIDIKRPAPHDGRPIVEKTRIDSDNLPKSITFQIKEDAVPIENLIKTANNMSSMMIAHRIALEDDFKLEPGLDMTGPMMSLSPIIGSSPSQSSNNMEVASEQSLQAKVKEIVHGAFWDLFRDELKTHINNANTDTTDNDDGNQTTTNNEDERKYDVSKQLLRDMRQRMIDLLLPQHTRLKQDIEDKMDIDIIDQLCKVNSLNLRDYGQYILSVLSKLCAPVRDEKIQELSATDDIVQQYRGIMELMELMRLDFANFTINRFKPHIKAHSQEYEREKFNEILKQQKSIGIDGVEYTRIWLNRAIDKFEATHGSLLESIKDSSDENLDEDDDGESNDHPKDQDKANSKPQASRAMDTSDLGTLKQVIMSNDDIINKILNAAYCGLLEWKPELQKLYPETLLCDEATFKHIAEQTKILTSTSAILLTAFAFLNRFKVCDEPQFKMLIKSHVVTLLTANYGPPTNQDSPSSTSISSQQQQQQQQQASKCENLDQNKLETIVTRLQTDLRSKVEKDNKQMLPEFDKQCELFKRQILDLENSTNRVRELSRRRIFEFIETLLILDVKHQQKKKMPSPVNIPLGLNCLANEITLITAQLVKIIRYNRRVFYEHYKDIIVESICKKLINRK